jgi:hypothetical protein
MVPLKLGPMPGIVVTSCSSLGSILPTSMPTKVHCTRMKTRHAHLSHDAAEAGVHARHCGYVLQLTRQSLVAAQRRPQPAILTPTGREEGTPCNGIAALRNQLQAS